MNYQTLPKTTTKGHGSIVPFLLTNYKWINHPPISSIHMQTKKSLNKYQQNDNVVNSGVGNLL